MLTTPCYPAVASRNPGVEFAGQRQQHQFRLCSHRQSSHVKRSQLWPLGINPVALDTMHRLASGQPVVIHRPAPAWCQEQFCKLHRDGSFAVPGIAERARRDGLVVMYAELWGRVFHGDGSITDYGLLGRRVVTDTGVAFVASAFNNVVEPEVLKYHGFGTGTTAESTAQTALVTEFTTEYASDNTRPTGSQANSSNTYTTVGTFSPDSGGTLAVTEHAIFSQAANSGGTMWDRTKFTAVNLVAGSDSLQATYVLTLPSGG